MSLLAYNLTTAPLALAAGVPIATLPASATAGARSAAMNVTGELKNLTAPDFALLQAQVAAKQVQYEWSGLPEFGTFTLVVGSAQEDASDLPVDLYADPTTGLDTNPGSLAAPVQTFEQLMNKKPAIYYQSLRFHLNIDPTTAALNTTKKSYTLSNQALQFLFPETEGSLGESVLIDGGFTNELGDKTSGQPGSTTILLNTSETLAADYAGALLTIVSGTGAGQKRIIRSNTQVVNSSIVPEGIFAVAPDATSVFRIGYPNVEITWSQRLLFAAPPQNLFMRGIKFIFAGVGTTIDFQIGNVYGMGGGGAFVATGCEWAQGSGGNKANLRARGTARAQFNADPTYWVGPNNPFVADDGNTGNFLHDGTALSTNVGGGAFGVGCLIKNFPMQARSGSQQIWQGCTCENSPGTASNDATWDLNSLNTTQRSRMRLFTGASAVTFGSLGKNTAPNAAQPGLNNTEFSDITGDCVTAQNNSNAYLGNVVVAGTNTGMGLKVQSGSTVQISAATGLAGNAGAIQIDNNAVLTLAQALAAPYNGTLRSNSPQPIALNSEQVYLSPTGNDTTGIGSFTAPMLTIPAADARLTPQWTKNSELVFLPGTYSVPSGWRHVIPQGVSGINGTPRAWRGGLASMLGSRTSTAGTSNLDIIDSTLVAFRSGAAASISAVAGAGQSKTMTLTGLTGMVAGDVGKKLIVGLAVNPYNNGTFVIASFISANSVTVYNPHGIVENTGLLYWQDSFAGEFVALDAKLTAVAVASLVNNDRFTALGENGVVNTFEYKVNGAFVPVVGRITIDVSALVTAADVATATSTALVALLANGTPVFSTTVVGAVVFIRTPRGIGAALTETVANAGFLVSSAQARKIDCHGIAAGSNPVGVDTGSITVAGVVTDGDTFTLNDGTNAPVVFTWKAIPAVATDILIGGTNAANAANARTAINLIAPTVLRLRATNTAGNTRFELINMIPGSSGNQAIASAGVWTPTIVNLSAGVGNPLTTFSTTEVFNPAPVAGDLFSIQTPDVIIDLPTGLGTGGAAAWGLQGIKFRYTAATSSFVTANVNMFFERVQFDCRAGQVIALNTGSVWNAAGGAGYASDVGTRMNANNSQVCVQMGVINLTVARALGRCHFNHCFLASSTTTPLGTVNGMSEVQYGNAFYAERSTFVLEKGTQANLGGAAARFGRMNGTLLPTDQAALQILAGCTLWGATALDISNCPNHGILATEGSRARLTSVAGRGNAKAGFQADNTGGVGIDRDSLTTTITGELGDAEHFHETPPNYVSYATIRTVIVGVKGYPITGDPRASYCTRIDA